MRRFLPFAALLGVALVLGCQEIGTGPDGLVPQFDMKGPEGEECPPEMVQELRDEKGHCHGSQEQPDATKFLVTMLSAAGPNFGPILTWQELLILNLDLDLSFFNGAGTGCENWGRKEGLLA